jgi:hypothetical protein
MQADKIIEAVMTNPGMSDKELAEVIGCPYATRFNKRAARLERKLVGFIVRKKVDKLKRWYPAHGRVVTHSTEQYK